MPADRGARSPVPSEKGALGIPLSDVFQEEASIDVGRDFAPAWWLLLVLFRLQPGKGFWVTDIDPAAGDLKAGDLLSGFH